MMVGGRYDNMRMCVATPAGVKGGPIADIALDTRFAIGDNAAAAISLPLMRPILFGIAFKMLQFEPEVTLEFARGASDRAQFVVGPGLGVSLHYGPDYRSDTSNKGGSFFAAGPFVSCLLGVQSPGKRVKQRALGVRAFYVPLFSGASDLSPGTVLGGALEGRLQF